MVCPGRQREHVTGPGHVPPRESPCTHTRSAVSCVENGTLNRPRVIFCRRSPVRQQISYCQRRRTRLREHEHGLPCCLRRRCRRLQYRDDGVRALQQADGDNDDHAPRTGQQCRTQAKLPRHDRWRTHVGARQWYRPIRMAGANSSSIGSGRTIKTRSS